jgi:rhamnose transport system substrate-binding protein
MPLTLFAVAALPVLTKTVRADDFELAMVIKETTNPYYNATLQGAQIAAKETGGKVNNYGPTQSSGQAQVELINNLADRHIPAIAVAASDPDAVVPAMKRAEKLGAKVITFDADSNPQGRSLFVKQSTSEGIGRVGSIFFVKSIGPK